MSLRPPDASRLSAAACLGLAVLALSACAEEEGLPLGTDPNASSDCDLDPRYLVDGGVGRDGIPALTDPVFVPAVPRTDATSYFRDTDRVIAYWAAGEWLVIPHNVMWRHEIVNLPEAAVTYCPLTGSALAFFRGDVDGAELGVSGLLYKANLIFYDRNQPDESLWPQMLGEARCGPRTGESLTPIPVIEMTWEGWVELHPDSKVLALTEDMFDPALYFFNPYGFDYEDLDNPDFLGFPIPLDPRRLPKERVLGLPGGEGPIAYPFEAMAEVGDLAVFELEHAGEPVVIFWDATRRAAMAYRPVVDGEEVRFRVTEEGIVDDATGTVWAVDGTPRSGPLGGTRRRLDQIDEAYVAFWGAWAAFHPDTELALGG